MSADEPEQRLLIAFGRESDARLLSSYLKQQGIAVVYQRLTGEHAHGLVLLDPVQRDEAKGLIAAFLDNPRAQKYQQAAWQQGELVKMQTAGTDTPGEWLARARSAPLTSLILILCLLVYGASLLGWFMPLLQWLSFQPVAILLDNQQWWRLLGPAFLHFSALHIIFNLLWWGLLGGQVEKRLGTVNLSIIFLLTAVLSNYGQFIASGPNFGGLSGVVYGLMGFVWWCGWLRPQWGLSLSRPLVGFILVWLVLGYADVLWVSMANTAHTIGLITGCLLAVIYTRVGR
ncbi:rhomboid family intramembrane serine protease GlpG [Bowmanella dokdonensis]|uniref:Rhomboid family intramembrane serine protease GlpG n=1 Tax=Bowmanella dokdonensis TaxID=751969 RepID=A0A939IKW8_9ALTE|nr:rhomboid family intramembrane serine protease GlpG [Bowmanella dokdonensis]MBN7823603.1 rhomboid family intramembrane serine protease GlpG [Bowmanella dokdonensis]